MPKYRKKPIVIEAWKVKALISAATTCWEALPKCITDAYESGDIIFLPEAMLINTLEGEHKANIDDWIIQGIKGELYPCKTDIFADTYEEVG